MDTCNGTLEVILVTFSVKRLQRSVARMTSVQAIMLFDAHQLADFVQQFTCLTCQHTGYDETGSNMGLSNIVLLK